MCCCLQKCCCGKDCNFFCWFISCVCSYYTICCSMMSFQVCKEYYQEHYDKKKEYEKVTQDQYINEPNIQMFNESSFTEEKEELANIENLIHENTKLPYYNPRVYKYKNNYINHKIYGPGLKTIYE